MLNQAKHQLIMGQILRDLYTDTRVAPLLGFKGGSAAFLFYGLPRFSVDLDFDLLTGDEDTQQAVFDAVMRVLPQYGQLKDSYRKRYTIFGLLSHGNTDHNVKVEINLRYVADNLREYYELKEYLGVSMLVTRPAYLFASKLAALASRPDTAMRDVFDVYYFAQNGWDIAEEILEARMGTSVLKHLQDCVKIIEDIPEKKILQGLGELLSVQQKVWVRAHLKADALFALKNYQSVLTQQAKGRA